MKIEEFKSGEYIDHGEYKAFLPSRINHAWTWDDAKINTLLEQATLALGELNGSAQLVPNVDIFIMMHVQKEASTSSRIEGTKTTLEEELLDRKYVHPEKRDDWQEVQNYVLAINKAIEELKETPFSNRLLRNAHRILMAGVRGKSKSPGAFRKGQVRIGGSGFEDAIFIPPQHKDVEDLMSDLELFLHNDGIDVPDLIRIAIGHYQFETIHPFLDGNGRIGRLMIPLYLISKGRLDKPCLYISDYLEKHREAYYDAFTVVRGSNHLAHWIKFFLLAVVETASKGKETFFEIIKLQKEIERQIHKLGRRSGNAGRILDYLYRKPFVNANDAAKHLEVSHQTASNLLKELVRLNVIKESTGFQRNRLYVFSDYIGIFRD
jgi:Fic family protein